MILADINDYLDGLNYNLNAEEKQLMDIFAECWEHCGKGDCHNCEYRSGNKWCKMLLCMSYQYAKRLIAAGYSNRSLSAADVAPVVHGHWIKRRYGLRKIYYHCSHCHFGLSKIGDDHYCPYCGAKMDEEKV